MIASENYVSKAVLEALGTVFVNRYAEGYPGARYYQGQAQTDAVERLAQMRALAIFGAEHANVQPYSGSPANMAAYMALCKPGDRVLGLGLNSGGHLTHGWKVNFSGQLYEAERIELSAQTELLDYEAIRELCLKQRPRLLIIGTTSYSRALDFKRFREIADEISAYFVADVAHPAGLIAADVYPNPVPYADVVTMTTHKTLRGPRGGMILCRAEHAKAIDRAVFPGIQGGPHMNQVAALAQALGEAQQEDFKRYGAQVLANARVLASELSARGLRIVSAGTDCHLMVVDLRAKGIDGRRAAIALEKAGIVCNFNAIPFDPNPPLRPSGIRLGTASLTTRGLAEAEMRQVAAWIVEVLERPEDEIFLSKRAQEIADFLKGYPLSF